MSKVSILIDWHIDPADVYGAYKKIWAIAKTIEWESKQAYKTDYGIFASFGITRSILTSWARMVVTSFTGKKGWEALLSDVNSDQSITTYQNQYAELAQTLDLLLRCVYCDPAYPRLAVTGYMPQGMMDQETYDALALLDIPQTTMQKPPNATLADAVTKIRAGEDVLVYIDTKNLPATSESDYQYAPILPILKAGIAANVEWVKFRDF